LPRPCPKEGGGAVRRAENFGGWREKVAESVCGGAIPGTRLDTLICDGLLPLAAADGLAGEAMEQRWRHWFPGDLPPSLRRVLVAAGVCDGAAHPLSHGAAQGALGWLIERGQR